MQARHALPLTLAAVLAAPVLSPGQETVPPAGQGFVLEAKEYTLDELLDRAAKYLRRNYLVQWTDTRRNAPNTVYLQQRLELDARGCEEVLTQLLYSCGWVMTPVDEGRGIYEWIHVQGNRRQEIQARSIHMQPDEVIRRKALKVHVTTSVPVQHLNPTNLSQMMRNLAGVTSFPSGAALVVTGYTDSVASALLTLKAIDQPGRAIEESLEGRLTDIERNLQSANELIQKNENRLQSAEKRIQTVEKKTSK